MQPREEIKFMFPVGEEPGLKSDASAKGKPLLIMFLAGPYGSPKKKEHAGKIVGIQSDPISER